MKAAFFFDTVLLKNKGNYYGMTLTYDFLAKRYLKYYDSLVVSTRFKENIGGTDENKGYRKTNGKRVFVEPIKSYKSIPDGILKRAKIRKEIEKIIEGVDVAIIRMPSMIGNIAFDACNKSDKKCLIEMVACPWDGYINHRNKVGKIVAPYMYLSTKKRIKNAKKVLYVTENFLQKRYPTNGDELACSDVVLNPIEDKILEERLKKIDEMCCDNIKMATVANVGLKYKGQEYVIKALARLKKRGNEKITYYLAGNGNKDYLESLAKKLSVEKQVVFLGSLNHEDVFHLIDRIDMYIQPSLQEGLPRSLLEAMSRACPCFGSDVGGIPELLSENRIFRRKRVSMIAKMLDNASKEELKKMAAECYARSKSYSNDRLETLRDEFYSMKGRRKE